MKKTAWGLTIILLISSAAHAGPASDYIQQMSYTGPGNFHGQQRDFFSAGSFSARWKPSTVEFPVSFTSPSLRAGCGGVDANLGAVSFLTDPKYLQSKLNAIVMGATVVGFMTAAEEICPTCMNAVRTAENIENQLNGLQMDTCKASKAIVTVASDIGHGRQSMRAEADAAWGQVSGAGSKFWQGAQDAWNANGGTAQSGDDVKMASCPAGIQNFRDIFIPPAAGAVYVLENIAAKKNIPSDYIAQVRGVAGDIKVVPALDASNNFQYQFSYTEPCTQTPADILGVFATGDNYERPSGFNADGSPVACVKVTDANANLVNWAYNQMNGIAAAIQGKSSLSSAQRNFAGMNSYPIHNILKLAVLNDEVDALTSELAEPVARAYAYKMLTEVVNSVKQGLYLAKNALSNQTEVPPGCEINHLVQGADAEVKQLDVQLEKLQALITDQYQKSFVQINHAMDYERKLEVYNETAMKTLSTAFGGGMARRATKKS